MQGIGRLYTYCRHIVLYVHLYIDRKCMDCSLNELYFTVKSIMFVKFCDFMVCIEFKIPAVIIFL